MPISIEFFVSLLWSALFTGIVGFEREFQHKPAGLKTHVLIGLGSTAITFLSTIFSAGGDPARIAAQIVSGIGFIGGGAILHSKTMVSGLTTAATLWVCAAIGLLVGAGMILPAGFLTLVIVGVMVFSKRLVPPVVARKYFMVVNMSDFDTAERVSVLLDHFKIPLSMRNVSHKHDLQMELQYQVTPITQHLLLKRLFRLKGIEKIQVF